MRSLEAAAGRPRSASLLAEKYVNFKGRCARRKYTVVQKDFKFIRPRALCEH